MNLYQRIKGGKDKHLSEGDYPPEWLTGKIQRAIRERAGHRCENCGLEFEHGTNKSIEERNGRRVIGTVHHIDWNKSNCTDENLVYLCQSCHYIIHLWGWKPGVKPPFSWVYGIPKWVSDRGLCDLPIYQLSLFD
jgi:hypothetical protein